jgi:hypothetical protein
MIRGGKYLLVYLSGLSIFLFSLSSLGAPFLAMPSPECLAQLPIPKLEATGSDRPSRSFPSLQRPNNSPSAATRRAGNINKD